MNIHIYTVYSKIGLYKNELRLQIRSSKSENGKEKTTCNVLRRRRQELNKCIKYLNVHKTIYITLYIYINYMLKSVWKTFFRISANNNKHFGRHASIANQHLLQLVF